MLWSISLSKIILLLNQKNLTQNPNAMNLQDIEAIKAMSPAAG